MSDLEANFYIGKHSHNLLFVNTGSKLVLLEKGREKIVYTL